MSVVDLIPLRVKLLLYFHFKNLLALGSDDKTLSISNADGDTVKQVNEVFVVLLSPTYSI